MVDRVKRVRLLYVEIMCAVLKRLRTVVLLIVEENSLGYMYSLA
jgi:hypothetical protein